MRKLLSLLLELLLCCPMACAEEEPPVHTSGSFECVLQPAGSAEITDYTGSAAN